MPETPTTSTMLHCRLLAEIVTVRIPATPYAPRKNGTHLRSDRQHTGCDGGRRITTSRRDEMLRKAAVPIVGLLALVLSGCASVEGSRTAAATSPADVNGTWKGGYVGGTQEYTMVLQQTGSKVTGTLTGAGTDD